MGIEKINVVSEQVLKQNRSKQEEVLDLHSVPASHPSIYGTSEEYLLILKILSSKPHYSVKLSA
jgi:hypothetical protein